MVEECIKSGNLDSFKELYLENNNVFNSMLPQVNVLTEVLKKSQPSFAIFLITETLFDINKTDDDKNTPFLLCFIKKYYDIAIMLIDSGFTDYAARNKRGMNVFNYLNEDVLVRYPRFEEIFLQRGNTEIVTPRELQLFTHEDLYETESSGAYGIIFYDSDRGLIYKSIRSSNMISIIREVIISRMVNIFHPTLSPTFHGIAVDGEDIYLVYESLSYSLTDAFKIYKNTSITTKSIYYTVIFKNILESLAKLHAMGILHSDLKPDNIMIDKHGFLRIIDYGLSCIIGVTKSNNIYKCTPTFKAPDTSKDIDNVSYYVTDNSQRYQITLQVYRYNLSSDVYSMGGIIMQALFLFNTFLVFYGDKILYCPSYVYEYELIPLEQYRIDIINAFSPHLMDLLRKVFDTDSRTRISAEELLQHPFFVNTQFSHVYSPNMSVIPIVDKIPFTTTDIKFGFGMIKNIDSIYSHNASHKIFRTNYTISTELLITLKRYIDEANYPMIDAILNWQTQKYSCESLTINIFEVLELRKQCSFSLTQENVLKLLNILSNFIDHPIISFSSCAVDIAIKRMKSGHSPKRISELLEYIFSELCKFYTTDSSDSPFETYGDLLNEIMDKFDTGRRYISTYVDDEEDDGIIRIQRSSTRY